MSRFFRGLQVFISGHYAGDDLNPKFGQGEPWKKVFGPVFMYVNSVMDGQDPLTLWDDAKQQVYTFKIVLEKLNIKLISNKMVTLQSFVKIYL